MFRLIILLIVMSVNIKVILSLTIRGTWKIVILQRIK